MTTFDNRLGKILSEDFNLQEMAEPLSGQPDGLDPQQFLQFLNAIVTSADHARSEQALQKAASMDADQLRQIVSRTEPLGNLAGLSDFISSKPSRMMGLIKIARILFQGPDLESVVDSMLIAQSDTETYAAEGDFYYDQGDDSDGH